jgi:DNA modification methylase
MNRIRTVGQLNKIDFDLISEDEFWNNSDEKELGIHKVHVYPAKFPSLIAQKSLIYAEKHKCKVERVSDVFCGCGTVAVEARRKGVDFWGCDINPIAVLLAKAKTNIYSSQDVADIGNDIIKKFKNSEVLNVYPIANQRLKYWYLEEQYNKLSLLKSIIDNYGMSEDYHMLFLCIFSSILKSTSKWLTKSIKPQIDPNKTVHDVLQAFEKQLKIFVKAIQEVKYDKLSTIEIERMNVLDVERSEFVDLIITSPPYVTSYEYADLHQLSSLWLGYTNDYTQLRTNSIGSLYNVEQIGEKQLTETAQKIVNKFSNNAQGRSIARYYVQMFQVIEKCYQLLRINGKCIFVIGDTEYRNVKIENAKCLSEAMIKNGFEIELITKRRVENKFLPSHRDSNGKFSSNKDDRQIYSQEYVIIGSKK